MGKGKGVENGRGVEDLGWCYSSSDLYVKRPDPSSSQHEAAGSRLSCHTGALEKRGNSGKGRLVGASSAQRFAGAGSSLYLGL